MASRRLLKTVLFLFGCCGWTFLIPPHTFLWYPLGLSHQRLAASTANIRMYSFVSIYYDIYSISQRFARLLSFLWLRAWVMCGFLKVWRVARFDTKSFCCLSCEDWCWISLSSNFIMTPFFAKMLKQLNNDLESVHVCCFAMFGHTFSIIQRNPPTPTQQPYNTTFSYRYRPLLLAFQYHTRKISPARQTSRTWEDPSNRGL